MLEFVKTFDLLGSISQFLQERRRSLGIPDGATLHPRLVNQEKGGLIIYAWNDLSEDVKVVGPVTHVGVYDPGTQKHKVLWIYNQKVKIVSCSLNRERTLLGFTIVTRQESGQDGKPKDVYQAFLAELQSLDTRVFSLNLQRHAYLKVQFLYPDANTTVRSSSGASSRSSRHSYLIVMLHKESIGLYQIHMARIGDRGIMMSGQPSTEQIVRKFVWCQWDAQTQRLYYIHNVRQTSSHADVVGQKLSTIQFHNGNKFDNMIDVPINFPFPFIRTSTRSSYADIPLHPGIPDATVNATVLIQTNGSLCLCYQEHIPCGTRPKPSSTLPEDDPQAATVNVNYYVCMVHHAKTLHGCATGLPYSVVVGKKIIFQWFGDYLVATMPGIFCHLLNVNVDFEPCHHILLHNHDIPTATKPPVPISSDSSSQNSAQLASGSSKSSTATISTSTDTSDTAQNKNSVMSEVGVSHHSAIKDSGKLSQDSSTVLDAEESTSAVAVKNLDVSSLSQPSDSLSQPQAPSIGSESTPSPQFRGLRISPQGFSELEETSVLSAVDKSCFRFGSSLVPCYGFSREAGMAGSNLYDSSSGCIWRLASNSDSLFRAFETAYWTTKLAILHYLLLLRTRDIFTIRQVFQALTADPTAPETTIFLSEFLVASTFANIRKKFDREITQLLSFTAADTFRGQFEKSSTGERLARITYISLDSVNISTKASHERRRRGSEDSWDLLRRSLRLKIMPPPARFSHEHILKALQKDSESNSSAMKNKRAWMNQELEESFFDSVKMASVSSNKDRESSLTDSGGRQSRTESILGCTPVFLQVQHEIRLESKKKVPAMTEKQLISHMIHHLKKESRIKAQNIAREYIISQNQQCQLLCHLLWSVHTEDTDAYVQLLPKLDVMGSDKEYKLFQLYERVFDVTQDLAFPRPPGFSSYFTALGFKCLTLSLFLQYVDRAILQLTPDFILQLMQDLPDSADPGNAETKFHIISRLPKPFAEDCFQRWRHPVLLHLSAQQQVAHVLQEGLVSHGRSEGTGETDEHTTDLRSRSGSDSLADIWSFKPLSIFIRHLEDTAVEVQRKKPGSTSLMYDTKIIEEAAFSFTRNYAKCDLSSMNF